MDRTAVLVDAGYLFAAGSKLIAGEKLARGELELHQEALLELLTGLAFELTALPLLRIYWYDGASAGPSPQQLALAYRPNVKLRLGFVNQLGQQHGVDSLVVTDLISLARNRAVADVLLMTGDEDIRVGVGQAQDFGVRVQLLGIPPARENQSALLVQEADGVRELTPAEVKACLSRAPSFRAAPAASASPSTGSTALGPLETAARRVAGELDPGQLAAALLESASGAVPAHLDRLLLVSATQALGGVALTPEQKRQVRAAFLDACRELQA